SISGQARTPDLYDALNQAAEGNLPDGVSVASRNISAPSVSPYTFSASADGTSVVLDGFVPDEETRAALVSAAQAARPGAEIDDRLRLASGAPAAYPARARTAIAALARLEPGNASLSDNALTIRGTARDYEAYTSSLRRFSSMADTDAQIEPSASAGSYDWKAERLQNVIILSGKAPSEDDRKAISERAAAIFPDAEIDNRMTVETGAPDGFRAEVNTALERLSLLEEGEASISGQNLAIRGRAKSLDDFDAVNTAVDDGSGEGFAVVERAITPPTVTPYVWSVVDTEAGSTIAGLVPDRGLGNANVAAARSVLGGQVTDEQRIAGGAPEGFGNAVAAVIGSVGQLENARGSLRNKTATVEGSSDSEARASRIRARLQDDLDRNGFTLVDRITFPEPVPEPAPEPVVEPTPEPSAPESSLPEPSAPEPAAPEDPAVAALPPKAKEAAEPEPEPAPTCNTDFAALFAGEKVQFATAKAVIQPVSFPLLDRIAAGLDGCSEKNIEIGGHTDSRGSERYNQGLSEARAKSVMAYLRGRGVEIGGLSAKGYGESSPIASNDNAEGQAANRRIEFKVVE
ncbi:MAG: OmpA family protein, partial [Pseudomonadota bacterium]